MPGLAGVVAAGVVESLGKATDVGGGVCAGKMDEVGGFAGGDIAFIAGGIPGGQGFIAGGIPGGRGLITGGIPGGRDEPGGSILLLLFWEDDAMGLLLFKVDTSTVPLTFIIPGGGPATMPGGSRVLLFVLFEMLSPTGCVCNPGGGPKTTFC